MHSDDLARLFGRDVPGVTNPMGARQGIIVNWEPNTFENVVRVGGTELPNLPVLGVAESDSYAPGDTVNLVVIGSTIAILAQFLIPGSQKVTDILNRLADRTRSANAAGTTNTTNGSFTTLTGPVLPNVLIGPSGKALVTATCTLNYGTDTVSPQSAGGAMSYAITGATNQTANSDRGPISFLNLAAVSTVIDRKTVTYLVTALNPGYHDFTAQYRSEVAGVVCNFSDRNLTVVAL
jgi:hypothetical protein